MTKDDIVSKVKSLNLPKGSYVVYGAAPLAAVGLRETNDIDLLVSGEIFKQLKERGWKMINKGPNDTPLTREVFEAHDTWSFSAYNPTLEDLLKNSFEVDGVPFASLGDVRKWKTATGRQKDLDDIKLIDSYEKT